MGKRIAWKNTAEWVDVDILGSCTEFSPILNNAQYYAELYEEMNRMRIRGKVYAVCMCGDERRAAYILNGFALRDYRETLKNNGGKHLQFYVENTVAQDALALYEDNMARPELWERPAQDE